jgi:predicted ATPase
MLIAARRFKRFYTFVPMVQKLLQEGRLEADKSQKYAIDYLGNLARNLENSQSIKNIWSVWSLNKGDRSGLKGAYIYGSVGSGKTMLMDLFYENVKIDDKARYHYNQFMLQFHSSN